MGFLQKKMILGSIDALLVMYVISQNTEILRLVIPQLILKIETSDLDHRILQINSQNI